MISTKNMKKILTILVGILALLVTWTLVYFKQPLALLFVLPLLGIGVMVGVPAVITKIKISRGLAFTLFRKNSVWIEDEQLNIENKSTAKKKDAHLIRAATVYVDTCPSQGMYVADRLILHFSDAENWTIHSSDFGYSDIVEWISKQKIPSKKILVK